MLLPSQPLSVVKAAMILLHTVTVLLAQFLLSFVCLTTGIVVHTCTMAHTVDKLACNTTSQTQYNDVEYVLILVHIIKMGQRLQNSIAVGFVVDTIAKIIASLVVHLNKNIIVLTTLLMANALIHAAIAL